MAIKSKIKGKKKHVNKPTSKKASKYKVEGGKIVEKARTCVKCGPGVFLMVAKDRFYCGKCHFTEFIRKDAEIKLETKA